MTVEVPLGQILKIDRDEVVIDPGCAYRTAGIYSFGRGVFERETIRGADTSYRSLFRLHEGQVILSKLNGWEGAVDVVTAEIDGCHVSNEYPTFSLDEQRADPGFLRWITRWPAFWDRLVPRGSMVRRKRVQPDQFLKVSIPLPPIDEQRRIAHRLGDLAGTTSLVGDLQSTAIRLDQALVDSSISSIFEGDGWPMKALGDVAEINPSPQRLDPSATIAFVPMAAVDGINGQVREAEQRRAGDIGPGYKQFREGDVIFARITPCMQNGKAAIYPGTPTYGYGSTEFHVIRAGPEVSSEWLHRVVRTREFRLSAAEHFTGTAGQQRVPTSFLKAARIPVPLLDEQITALKKVDRISAIGLEISGARSRSKAVLAALVPAALNEAFA